MGAGKYVILASALAVLAAIAGYTLSVPHTPDAPLADDPGLEPPPPSPDAARWDFLAADLAGADPAVKKAALDSIPKTPYQKREHLERLLQTLRDPAATNAIHQRLDEIYEMLATNPPPVSLHVQHASLRKVMEALNAEMGTRMQWGFGNGDHGDYTIDADNVPFWNIIAELATQGVWGVRPGDSLTFNEFQSGGTAMRLHTVSGPFFMYVHLSDNRSNPVPRAIATARAAGDWPQPVPSFMLNYTVVVDPRLPISICSAGNIQVGKDSADHELRPYSSGSSTSTPWGCNGYMQIPFPENWGETITSVKAGVSVTTFVPAQSITVEAIEDHAPWQGFLTRASGDVHVSVPSATEDVLQGTFSLTCAAQPPERADQLVCQVFNNTGKMCWAQRGMPDETKPYSAALEPTSRRPADQKPDGTPPGYKSGRPYRFVAKLDKTTHQLTATLEVKDIPLPPR